MHVFIYLFRCRYRSVILNSGKNLLSLNLTTLVWIKSTSALCSLHDKYSMFSFVAQLENGVYHIWNRKSFCFCFQLKHAFIFEFFYMDVYVWRYCPYYLFYTTLSPFPYIRNVIIFQIYDKRSVNESKIVRQCKQMGCEKNAFEYE